MPELSRRAYCRHSTAWSWEEIWEAGSYYDRLSELLEDAEHYVVFVGWQVDSRLPFSRPGRPQQRDRAPDYGLETLKEKVTRLCTSKPGFQVFFLMWDHAYFYALEREVLQGRVWDDVHPRVHFVFDNRHPFGGAHHEKIVLIDGRIALCGGIDLCNERWDSPHHFYTDPRRSLSFRGEKHGPYHDLAVQVTGPVYREIHEHVCRRWQLLSSIPFPPPRSAIPAERPGGHSVYISRTVAGIDVGDLGRKPIVREVEFLYRDLIFSAERRLIFEGQYFWSPRFNELLMSKIRQMSGRPFEVVLIVADLEKIKSLTRHMAHHQLRLLAQLQDCARQARVPLRLGAPYSTASDPTAAPKPIYVHSKLIISDDQYLCIGSANFASRAFRIDTELNLTLAGATSPDRLHISRFAEQVLQHWNLTESRQRSTQFRIINAPAEVARLRSKYPWSSRLPWKRLIDPVMPWMYPLKLRTRRFKGHQKWALLLSLLLLWSMSAELTWYFSHAVGFWPKFYGLLLVSVWLLPVPFFPLSCLAAIQLGEPGMRVAVGAFWIASLFGYSLTRAFPTLAGRYYRTSRTRWLPTRLGLRSFPYLISVLADPRVGVRAKIAFQGLFCIPLPWFVLGTLLVLPGALFLVTETIALWSAPLRAHELLELVAPYLLLLLLAWTAGAICAGFIGKRVPRTAEHDPKAYSKDGRVNSVLPLE